MSRVAVRRPPVDDDRAPVDSAAARRPGAGAHPWAWWGWAIGAAVAASCSTNPLFLVLLLAAVLAVVLARRTQAPWARMVGLYLTLALFIVGFRMVMMALVGGHRDGLVLVHLPELTLPVWAAGITIGGPVTLNAMLAALYDGLRLAALMICVGAANALANPRQALKSVPAALNHLSVSIVIALTLAPQVVESTLRVRRARRLRGGKGKGWTALTAVLVPTLEDALERSLKLATAMESRGYGRAVSMPVARERAAGALLVVSLAGLVGGLYAVLAMPHLGRLAWLVLALAAAGVVLGLRLAGGSHRATRYRPHPWRWHDTTLVALGALAAGLSAWGAQVARGIMHPGVDPLEWPQAHWTMPASVLLLAAAIAVTPPPADRPTALRQRPAATSASDRKEPS